MKIQLIIISLGLLCLGTSPSLRGLAHEYCPQYGVDPTLALQIMRRESGCYPYAIGVQPRGQSHYGYFPERQDVAELILADELEVTPNVGIGAMQINWRVWGDAFNVNPADLLNPEINIMIGCGILGRYLEGSGSLIVRAGGYHSLNEPRRSSYGKSVIEAMPCEN